jgi:hypothetical protein
MSDEFAAIVLAVLGIHFAIGVVFAIAFQARGLGQIDAAAARGSRGFRVVITPGVIALWPILLCRWLRVRGPPT